MKENLILTKTFDFALEIVELYKILLSEREFVLSKQIVRAGTSIGANVEEAIAGHSRKDFIAKLVIAAKEARETRYFLKLMDRSQLVQTDYSRYLKKIEDILNILYAIIKTSQINSQSKNLEFKI
jgi:four helix bundle protein